MTRGDPGAPRSHSRTAALFVIRAPASTQRLEPHCQHRSSRGRVAASASPTWPQEQATLTSTIAPRKIAPADTGAEVPPREIRIPGVHATRSSEVPARAKIRLLRGRGWRYRPHCRRLILAGTKKPPVSPGAKFQTTAWGKTGKSNPRHAIILARRWHGRDGERAAEAAPSISAHGLVSTFGTNNWPARAIITADPSMSAAGRCGHFN